MSRSRRAAAKKPRCSIVIPVHNQAGMTAKCIDAILASPPEVTFEIVVIDDASTDHTPAVLDEYTKPVRSIRRDENAGFARACNQGAKEARGELLVFLNNDTIPLRGWLDALVEDADGNPDTAVVGAKLLFPNDTVQHAGRRRLPGRQPAPPLCGLSRRSSGRQQDARVPGRDRCMHARPAQGVRARGRIRLRVPQLARGRGPVPAPRRAGPRREALSPQRPVPPGVGFARSPFGGDRPQPQAVREALGRQGGARRPALLRFEDC